MDQHFPTIRRLLDASAATARIELQQLSAAALLDGQAIHSASDAELVRAALYLHHAFLEDCHRICQQVPSANGSYWHGILHRHEGDLDNARYWYHRAGQHPVLAAMGGFPESVALQQREFELLLAHTLACATATNRPGH